MLKAKNRFKTTREDAADRIVELKPGSAFLRPEPQPILKPRAEDIPALVKSDIPMSFWVECTPEIMRACLDLNKENYRPWMKSWSDQIASDMKAKPCRFKQAGDPVRFNVDGIMIDAQHRFHAGIDANFTFVFLFVVGLPKEAREVIDFLRPRKISHVVRNMGYENAYMLSSAAGWLCKFKKGSILASGLDSSRNAAGTVEEILDTLKRHSKLHESTTACKQKGRQLIPGSLLATVHYIGSVCLGKPDIANDFLFEFKNYPRKSKQAGAPFAWCRELEERRQWGLDTPRDFKVRGTVEAWNLFMQGIEVEKNIEVPERLSFKDLNYDVL